MSFSTKTIVFVRRFRQDFSSIDRFRINFDPQWFNDFDHWRCSPPLSRRPVTNAVRGENKSLAFDCVTRFRLEVRGVSYYVARCRCRIFDVEFSGFFPFRFRRRFLRANIRREGAGHRGLRNLHYRVSRVPYVGGHPDHDNRVAHRARSRFRGNIKWRRTFSGYVREGRERRTAAMTSKENIKEKRDFSRTWRAPRRRCK